MARVRNAFIAGPCCGESFAFSFDTAFIDNHSFSLTVTRLDQANGWPDGLFVDFQLADGLAYLGASDGNTKEVEISTEASFPPNSAIAVEALPGPHPDTFDFAARWFSPDRFVLQVTRTDRVSGWGQSLPVCYHIGRTEPRRLRIPLGTGADRKKSILVETPFPIQMEPPASHPMAGIQHVSLTRDGFNACLAPCNDGWLRFERTSTDYSNLRVHRFRHIADGADRVEIGTIVADPGEGLEDPKFAGVDNRRRTVLALSITDYESDIEPRMGIVWLDREGKRTDSWRIEEVEGLESLRDWEKNWVPVCDGEKPLSRKLTMVYLWEPLTLIELDLERKTARRLSGEGGPQTPLAPDSPRGSTPLIRYRDGYIALIHNSEYEHQFVVLDKQLNIQGRSDWFRFDQHSPNTAEFCCSMVLDGSRLWFVWSSDDNCVRHSCLDTRMLDAWLEKLFESTLL